MTTSQHLYPPFIVGKYKGEYLKYYGQDFLMTAAGTRSGKGTSLVIPNLLTYPDSVVVEDIKEENYHYTSGYRRACGHETWLWAPFSEDGRSHAYNPLGYIQRRAPYTRVGDVMTIGEHLYPSNVDARLKYWNDNARNLFIGIVLYLLETPSLPCTFGEVLRQASGKGRAIREHISSIVSTRADAAHATDGLPPLTFECLDALNRFLSQSKEAFANIVSTMTAPLNVFSNPVVDAATSRSDFDLADVRKKRMSIYVGIKPGDLKAGALLVNLFFSQLIDLNTRELPAENPALKYQCALIMDEFAAPGKIDIIDTANPFIAGYNLRLMLIFQGMSQIEDPKLYGRHGAETLAINCKMRSLYAPRTVKESEEYSKMLGTFTLMARSKSRSRGRSSSTSTNESAQGRALMMPQELRALKHNKQIITMEGCEPILCEKAFFYEDAELVDRLVRQSPYLQGVTATLEKTNRRRAWFGFGPKFPNEVQMKHAAFVARELCAPVPKIDVEQWWQTQNAARRAQQAAAAADAARQSADKSAGLAREVRDVREHEIGVLAPVHLANRHSIRASLFQLMPYLREVLPDTAAAAAAVSAQTTAPQSQPESQGELI
ncbi:type IV secretory system conjugative DNA transfer family protein [Paraburkholderia fungorum]|uniref:Type IV secretory system conjugative DNA transfer family protein n=1 Tax=Paraburkholderia fungorum TaxID=134537 RepID=A0AAP5QH98_9BURK|nr:type IV secretory system conjugative DNA transfer family protein [Paraburkholderia fungorum]MDT8843653.1 type IV secretory system conjugative DNA transfer family protein [Paraburkholderia fungorum]